MVNGGDEGVKKRRHRKLGDTPTSVTRTDDPPPPYDKIEGGWDRMVAYEWREG